MILRQQSTLSFDEWMGIYNKLKAIGWLQDNPDTNAGPLWSGLKKPSWTDSDRSNLVEHSIQVEWDCCCFSEHEDNETKLISKEIK